MPKCAHPRLWKSAPTPCPPREDRYASYRECVFALVCRMKLFARQQPRFFAGLFHLRHTGHRADQISCERAFGSGRLKGFPNVRQARSGSSRDIGGRRVNGHVRAHANRHRSTKSQRCSRQDNSQDVVCSMPPGFARTSQCRRGHSDVLINRSKVADRCRRSGRFYRQSSSTHAQLEPHSPRYSRPPRLHCHAQVDVAADMALSCSAAVRRGNGGGRETAAAPKRRKHRNEPE